METTTETLDAPRLEARNLIAIERAKSRLNQRELARLVGCHFSHISQIENRTKKPSRQLLERIARVFKLDSPLDLFPSVFSNDKKSPNDS